jgi:RimJ/RimL family protein N-acetyltransferase
MKNTILLNITIFILFIILILIISYIICFINDSNNKYGGNLQPIQPIQPSNSNIMNLTYSINGEDSGLDYTQLRKVLNSSNFKEVDKLTPNVHLSIGGFDEKQFKLTGKSAYSDSFLKQHASLKNLLDKHRMVTEKTQLYTTMQNNIPLGMKYLPYTNSLANIKNIKELFLSELFLLEKKGDKENKELFLLEKKGDKENKGDKEKKVPQIYVLKVNKSRQTGIKIISSEAELNNAIKELNIIKKEDAIISKYITNPLTIDGKKFHLRVYFLVYIRWGITYCTAFDDYKILTAGAPYVQSDWLNEKIHLSGGKNSAKRYYWKDIAKTINNETKQTLIQCIKSICMAIVLTGMKPFGEADSAYHTFGADIILTDDNMAYLLEINRRAAMTQIGEDEGWAAYNKTFSYDYFMFIAKHVIFPYFGLYLPQPTYAEFANGFHSSLAEFSHSFIENKLELLPLSQASEDYKQKAHSIHFYSLLSFKTILNLASSENIWLIVKNNEVIGYACIEYINLNNQSLPSIKIGITQKHQRRQIGTSIIALLIEIYASREFPKNPVIYLPILQNMHTKEMVPTNKIALKLGFKINDKLKIYTRLCKILSPKILKNLLNTKMYIISEFHSAEEFKIFLPFFNKKEGYSFAHIIFGKIQNNEFYLSNGIRYTINFLNQGAEMKNCITMKDGLIYKKYRLCEKFKELYNTTNITHFLNASNRCKNIALDNFKTYQELLEYGKNYKFILYKDGVDKFTVNITGAISDIIKSPEEFKNINSNEYITSMNDNNFMIDNKSVLYLATIIIYKSSGISYALLEREDIHISKMVSNNIIIIGDDTIATPYKEFNLTKNHTIDEVSLDENIKSCVYLLLNMARLYPEQHAGFHKYGVLNKLCIIDGKIIPYISEIFSIMHNYINVDFIAKNIILPHFGIMAKTIPYYMTQNCNDGPLSKFYDQVINMSIIIDNNKNNLFNIIINGKNIGHIELEIITHEIEIKHIELDPSHRKKNISASAIAQLLEILGARYAPLNPIIFFKQLESIAEKLLFHKIKHKDEFIYKRLCRLKKNI